MQNVSFWHLLAVQNLSRFGAKKIAALHEIFSANVRYTGITLGYQLGAALAGGTAPLIATGLLAKYDGDWVPVAWYLAVTVAISLIAIFCASRVKRTPAVQAQPDQI